jgi:hypothetical protein
MKTLTSSLIAVSMLVGFAPGAHADSSSDYLSALDTLGVSSPNPTTALNAGNAMCQQLHSNAAPDTAAQAGVKAGYTVTQAVQLLTAASKYLCPDTWDAVNKWANSP